MYTSKVGSLRNLKATYDFAKRLLMPQMKTFLRPWEVMTSKGYEAVGLGTI